MKFLFLSLCAISFSQLFAQITGTSDSIVKVKKVKSWKMNTIALPKGYWDDKEKQIVKQIGQVEFDKIKAFSYMEEVPSSLQLNFAAFGKEDLEQLENRRNKLKLYRIALYDLIKDDGEKVIWCILKAPFSENKELDPQGKWQNLYFLLPDEDVEIEK